MSAPSVSYKTSTVVPSSLEEKLVRPGETAIKRWEGICTEEGHHKWWAGVVVKTSDSRFTYRSSWGKIGAPSGQVRDVRVGIYSDWVALRNLKEKVDEKRNLRRTRPYSYSGEWVTIEAGDPSPRENPKIEEGLFARVMLRKQQLDSTEKKGGAVGGT